MISVHCFRFHRALSVWCVVFYSILKYYNLQFHGKCFVCGSCCCCVWRCRLRFFAHSFGSGATLCRSVWYKRPACKSNHPCCFVCLCVCLLCAVLTAFHSQLIKVKTASWLSSIYSNTNIQFVRLFMCLWFTLVFENLRKKIAVRHFVFNNNKSSVVLALPLQEEGSNNFNSILFANLWW